MRAYVPVVLLVLVFLLLAGIGVWVTPVSVPPEPIKTVGVPKAEPPTRPKAAAAVPGEPPADWTHKELVAYLAQKGIVLTVKARPNASTGNRILAALIDESTDPESRIGVFLCADTNTAREQVGAAGAGAFRYGRFAFCPNDDGAERHTLLLKRIAAALR